MNARKATAWQSTAKLLQTEREGGLKQLRGGEGGAQRRRGAATRTYQIHFRPRNNRRQKTVEHLQRAGGNSRHLDPHTQGRDPSGVRVKRRHLNKLKLKALLTGSFKESREVGRVPGGNPALGGKRAAETVNNIKHCACFSLFTTS